MESKPLVFVVPRLSPYACGLGQYAWELHRHWPVAGTQNRFAVLSGAKVSRDYLHMVAIEEFSASARSLVNLLEQQDTDDVLLHYAGRAYHRFGFPRWMPRAFKHWQRRNNARRLHIIFHELPADLPLLSKQGILQRLSFPVARSLAEQAITVITNSEHHAAVLNRWQLRSAVEWFPVPSNIPAPAEVQRRTRRGEFAIFGLPYTRLQTVRLFADWLSRWHASGRLTRLHLIGPRDQKFAPQADALAAAALPADAMMNHGELEPDAVSKALLEVEFCLSSSDKLTWSKSGTFMACAAHGCCIVIPERENRDPLRLTVAAADLATTVPELSAQKGAQLHTWYLEKADWDRTGKRVAELICDG